MTFLWRKELNLIFKTIEMEDRINKILLDIKAKGWDSDRVIAQLTDFREYLKEIKKPFMVRATRVAYEYIGRNDEFAVDVFEERGEGEGTSFEYFLTLLKDADNLYNREELDEYIELMREDED
jgi:hypothetical protein